MCGDRAPPPAGGARRLRGLCVRPWRVPECVRAASPSAAATTLHALGDTQPGPPHGGGGGGATPTQFHASPAGGVARSCVEDRQVAARKSTLSTLTTGYFNEVATLNDNCNPHFVKSLSTNVAQGRYSPKADIPTEWPHDVANFRSHV